MPPLTGTDLDDHLYIYNTIGTNLDVSDIPNYLTGLAIMLRESLRISYPLFQTSLALLVVRTLHSHVGHAAQTAC